MIDHPMPPNPTRVGPPDTFKDGPKVGTNPERIVLPIPLVQKGQADLFPLRSGLKEGTNRFFPKCSHIKKAGDFREVFSKGKFFVGGYFKIGVLRNSLSYARFGICIPKGATRKATVRNRLKRQIRESIRLNRDRIKKGFDIVLILRPTLKRYEAGLSCRIRINGQKNKSGAHFDKTDAPGLKSETIKSNILKVLFESGALK